MHIATVVNSENPLAYDASMLLSAYFSSQGIANKVIPSASIPAPEILAERGEKALEEKGIHPFDMAVALGGDGTILRTARVAMIFDAPVLGINFGHLGFLANPSQEGVVPLVAAALAGDVTEDKRYGLQVEVVCEPAKKGAGKGVEGNVEGAVEERHLLTALNEVTITRGSCPRNLETQVSISGDALYTLRGDGLIVATATGSTAYALSAGGPLVSPGLDGMVVVPLPTHTLQSRALMTEKHDVLQARFDTAKGYTFAEVQLDGMALHFPTPVQQVIVRIAKNPVRLLFYKKESFYSRIARTFFS